MKKNETKKPLKKNRDPIPRLKIIQTPVQPEKKIPLDVRESLASFVIMGAQLRAPLKPLSTIVLQGFEGFQGGPLSMP